MIEAGDLTPGFSPGLMDFDVNSLALGPFSSVDIELDGPILGFDHDQVNVSGMLFANGTIDVLLLGGFGPGPGDSFESFTYGSLSGGFNFNLPAGELWAVDVGATSITLSVVPLPSAAVCGVALLGALGVIRGVSYARSKSG